MLSRGDDERLTRVTGDAPLGRLLLCEVYAHEQLGADWRAGGKRRRLDAV